jgi:hypothetical protein
MGKGFIQMKSEREFWRVVIVGFALLSVVVYLPALTGQIPFPRDIVLHFAAWNGMVRSEAWQPYADIGDLVTAFYPARAFAARSVREGSLPLWNPYFLGGAPFLANAQSSLFYPPNFLYYLLPLPVAWTLALMLRVFLSGIFMTLFVRHIGGSRAGSTFSGIVLALCGFMTAWQGQPMVDSATWLPLMCYAVLRLQESPSTRWIVGAAFAFAMPVLAGHPETAAHVTLTTITLALVTWFCTHFDRGFLFRFILAGLLAAGLSSIQMIPTLEWLGQMPGALQIRWPVLPPKQILSWVSRDIFRGPNSANLQVPEAASYAGMISLLAASLGLIHSAKRHVLFLSALSLAALAIAYGVEPLHSIVSYVPVLAGVKNGRMIYLATFGIAALAGLGVSALEKETCFKQRDRGLALVLVMVAFAVVLLMVYDLRLATEIRVEFTRRPSFSRALLIAGLIPLLLRLYGGLSASMFSVVACAVVAFDLISFSYGFMGFSKPDEIFPSARIFDFLKQNANPARFRVAPIGLPYPANANVMYQIASPDGYEVQLTPWQRVFSLDYIDEGTIGISFTGGRLLRFNDRRLDMLNVKYLILEKGSPEFSRFKGTDRFALAYNSGYVAAFENKSVLPRAFLVPASGVKVLPEFDNQLAVLRDPTLDPQKTAVVSRLPEGLKIEEDSQAGISGLPLTTSVETTAGSVNDVKLRTTTPLASILVLSQTYYPGWKAEVDGRRTEVFPVNIALTGIQVPAGLHEIRFDFLPLSFEIGAALTLASALTLLALLRNGLVRQRG